ncbi:hypothetical protein [uncultured Pontibacter sp.]|uniref:hypothetical protein n=1 Tax=uncultured Pontibacter sp. TaxID=453356 RepID=UPI002602EEBF|nr:hypothetical protein [uncultured Pontibacter sp.]
MALIQPKYRSLRHLMVSLTLLWALLSQSAGAYAHSTAQIASGNPAGMAQTESLSSEDSATGLQQAMVYLAQEGTASTITFSLQQVATVAKAHVVKFSGDKAIPPYAARAPGDNFFCQFFYTSSQPQAP